MTGNNNSQSIILKNQKSLEQVKDYNGLAVGFGMLSAEKDANEK